MATMTYTGSFTEMGRQTSDGFTQTAELTKNGNATNAVNSVSASVIFQSYGSYTYEVTVTLTFNDNTTKTSTKSITTPGSNKSQTETFTFSGLTLEQANNIKSISTYSPTVSPYIGTLQDCLFVLGNCSVTIDYTAITKVSTPTISVATTSTASSTVIIANRCLLCAFIAWFLCQGYKGISLSIKNHRWHIRNFFGAGGMPSSHTASVVALTVSIGAHYGFGTPLFAACSVFSIVVMYDAAGVRRETGRQSVVINEIVSQQQASFEYQQLKE